MTATPVLSGKTAVQDAKRMLELVKGAHFAARNNEGFVSWYMERPSSLFGRLKTPTRALETDPNAAIPITSPSNTQSKLPNVYAVRIDTYQTRHLWRHYVAARFTEKGVNEEHSPKQNQRKKHEIDNTDVDGFFSKVKGKTGHRGQRCLNTPQDCNAEWTVHENVMVMKDETDWSMTKAAEVAPKLAAMAQSILETPVKTLVILDSRFGARQLAALLHSEDVSVIFLANTNHLSTAEQKQVRAKNAIRLQAFNATNNRLGESYRVAVAEVEGHSEGVSFMHVRRIIVDPGFGLQVSWATMEQRIGRALRSCSHEGLPKHMKSVQVDMFIAVHGQMDKYPPTIDVEKLEFIEKEIPQIQKGMDFLRGISIDAEYYGTNGA